MRYLAQVHRQEPASEIQLKLLATQKAEHLWALVADKDESIPCTGLPFCEHEGVLVILELSDARQIVSIQPATTWVLDIIEQYLSRGLSPEALQQEVDVAEQWRQSLTLRSQELGRQAVEIEARRGQIEHLEAKLIEEKKRLEAIASQLRSSADSADSKDDNALNAVHSPDD